MTRAIIYVKKVTALGRYDLLFQNMLYICIIIGNTKVYRLVLSDSNLTVQNRVEISKSSLIISFVYGAGCCFFSTLWALSEPEFD